MAWILINNYNLGSYDSYACAEQAIKHETW